VRVYEEYIGNCTGVDTKQIRRRSGITQVYVRYNSGITPGILRLGVGIMVVYRRYQY
jgi:hypothetical protein